MFGREPDLKMVVQSSNKWPQIISGAGIRNLPVDRRACRYPPSSTASAGSEIILKFLNAIFPLTNFRVYVI